MSRGARIRLLALACWAAAVASPAGAADLRIFGPAEMGTWDYPRGLVGVGQDGMRVRPFTGHYNAMADEDFARLEELA